jgi:hypothetical protein
MQKCRNCKHNDNNECRLYSDECKSPGDDFDLSEIKDCEEYQER